MAVFGLIVFIVVFRVVPHPPNFVPVGASAVFSGRVLPLRLAIPAVVAAMFASDFFLSRIHGYSWLTPVSLFVYGGFALQVLLGRALRSVKGGSLVAAGTGGLLFFLVSNFGVWLAGGLYPRTGEGLVSCYVLALPFLKATLAGDLVWTAMLSFLHRLYRERRDPAGDLLPAV